MEFLFKCSTRVEHQKRNSISPSNHVLFCLLHKNLTNEMKPAYFTLQIENVVPFIHGAK